MQIETTNQSVPACTLVNRQLLSYRSLFLTLHRYGPIAVVGILTLPIRFWTNSTARNYTTKELMQRVVDFNPAEYDSYRHCGAAWFTAVARLRFCAFSIREGNEEGAALRQHMASALGISDVVELV